MAKATNGPSSKSFNLNYKVKKEPSPKIEKKQHLYENEKSLNVFPARDINCKNCNYKGHFAKLCKSKNKRPSVKLVNDSVTSEFSKYVPSEDS